MKKTYAKPALFVHGDVAKLTQVLGGDSRVDFVFNSDGDDLSGGNDLGSADVTIR